MKDLLKMFRQAHWLQRASRFSRFLVATPEGSHPIPSRTRKLSPPRPMVLHGKLCGRVGRCQNFLRTPPGQPSGGVRLFMVRSACGPWWNRRADRSPRLASRSGRWRTGLATPRLLTGALRTVLDSHQASLRIRAMSPVLDSRAASPRGACRRVRV